jgi:hypothetical protein
MKVMDLVLFVLLIGFVVAVDCPYGHIDEPYPGECGRYIDQDIDGLCDLSQEESFVEIGKSEAIEKSVGHKGYPFILISLSTLVLYLVSFMLWKNKKIGAITHKKIWNLVLLISFVISGGLGILLILRINYGWFLGLNMMRLHVNAGVVLAEVSLFHVLEHMPFWKSYFR